MGEETIRLLPELLRFAHMGARFRCAITAPAGTGSAVPGPAVPSPAVPSVLAQALEAAWLDYFTDPGDSGQDRPPLIAHFGESPGHAPFEALGLQAVNGPPLVGAIRAHLRGAGVVDFDPEAPVSLWAPSMRLVDLGNEDALSVGGRFGDVPGKPARTLLDHLDIEAPTVDEAVLAAVHDRLFGTPVSATTGYQISPLLMTALCDLVGVAMTLAELPQVAWAEGEGMPPMLRLGCEHTPSYVPVAAHIVRAHVLPAVMRGEGYGRFDGWVGQAIESLRAETAAHDHKH